LCVFSQTIISETKFYVNVFIKIYVLTYIKRLQKTFFWCIVKATKRLRGKSQMKFVAIVGTNSGRSTNRKLLQFMAKHFADQAEIEVLEIKDLPAFNEPADKQTPAAVAQFSEKILNAPELKARVMPGIEFFLGHSEQALSADSKLLVPEKVAELEENFAEFLEFTKITHVLVNQANTDRKRNFAWELTEEE